MKLRKLVEAILLCFIVTTAACGGGGGNAPAAALPAPIPQPILLPITNVVVPEATSQERFSGGQASTSRRNEDAFGQLPDGLEQNFEIEGNFKSGNAIFRNDHEGEGPLVNARTCRGCHTRDGRGAVPRDPATPMDEMSVRIGLGVDLDGTSIPDPNYGVLLQVFGLDSFDGDIGAGLSSFGGGAGAAIGEGYPFIEYEAITGLFSDGTAYELRKPTYRIRELSYGEFDANIQFSARVSPQIFGLGLLGAVEDSVIMERADQNDLDEDGVSGRAAMIRDSATGALRVGRFGAKASVVSILQQTASAYRADMGVTSSLAPDEACTLLQTSCMQAALAEPNQHVGGVDISDTELALVEFYVRLLAVPERRGFSDGNWNEEILAGRRLFFESGCESCHRQTMITSTAQGSVLGQVALSTLTPGAGSIEVLSGQTIYPYSDLLLHDLGGKCSAITPEHESGLACGTGENCTWVQRCEGLADGRPEGQATGVEWRTAPLWGLGLVQTVNPNATFLHDGRARNIEEAIIWHGGEGQAARDAFLGMSKEERSVLSLFLESL